MIFPLSVPGVFILAAASAAGGGFLIARYFVGAQSTRLHRLLQRDFGFTRKRSLLLARAFARGTVEGHELVVGNARIGHRAYIRIRLKSGRFLPPPLEIMKPGAPECAGYEPPPAGLRLGTDDFEPLNRSIGRNVLDAGLQQNFLLLDMRAESYAAYDDTLVVNLRYGGSESLAPLSALAGDGRLPADVRAAAAGAARLIAARCGLQADGRLSIAGGEPGAGGLSKAEDERH
jgi:hypothetical protein